MKTILTGIILGITGIFSASFVWSVDNAAALYVKHCRQCHGAS